MPLDAFVVPTDTFPPADASCASADVIWIVFALTCGAVDITAKNFFSSTASIPRLEAVFAVLAPADAS